MPSRHRVHLLNCYDESTAATKIRRRALRRRDGGGRRTRQKLAKLQSRPVGPGYSLLHRWRA
jgi:hypothetical protein